MFKAAQKAADTYLENVKRHTDNADRIEAEATAAAEQLLEKARTEADSLTITHDAKSRRGFALGAVLAAEYTATHEGLLGMNDLFDF